MSSSSRDVQRAFGVDPGNQPYRLRLARYHAIGESIAAFVANRDSGKPVRILDVGGGEARTLRYVEAQCPAGSIDYTLLDLLPPRGNRIYRRDEIDVVCADATKPLPFSDVSAFDVVVCEQLLEHLETVDVLLGDLHRVLRLDGLLVLGVPTYPPGIAAVRAWGRPWVERLLGPERLGSHIGTFSRRSIESQLRTQASWTIEEARGFRIFSGGPLRPLENYRWWWRFNRWLGSWLPSLCVEVQLVARKR